MFLQVFSPDKSVYEAVETAFMTIYVKNIPPETAKSLLSLAVEANMGDLAALEFIVGVLVSKGDISSTTVRFLVSRLMFFLLCIFIAYHYCMLGRTYKVRSIYCRGRFLCTPIIYFP